MEKWEYVTKFVWASVNDKEIMAFIKERWPNWEKPPKFAPQAMIPELNEWGEAGWEVVHMQPVWPGKNMDVHNSGVAEIYTNVYFCVMKRRKE